MSKKAVIATGGKQYLVEVGNQLLVEKLNSKDKTVEFEPLLIVDGEKTEIGKPILPKIKVYAEIIDPELKTEKVTSIRYKAKKRVKTIKGHRQIMTSIEIKKIA